MKNLKYIFILVLIGFMSTSCSKDDNGNNGNPDINLHKLYSFDRETHIIEIYSEKNRIETGYTELYLRFQDKNTSDYKTDVQPVWEPVMQMGTMVHGAPYGNLKLETNGFYKGFIIFTMAGDEHHFWELNLEYKIDNIPFSLIEKMDVSDLANGDVNVQNFTGIDENHYVLALKEPKNPKVAVNDMEALLYKMEDMMTFSIVENHTLTIDPRMPSMGNHSSPNNEDLIYNANSKSYKGKLSLTMTGLWRINMKLINPAGEVLKGEDITENHPESSLYFEMEF